MKMRTEWIVLSFVFCCGVIVQGGPNWGRYLRQPDDWYRSEEGRRVIENILSWQDEHGGWPKNTDTVSKAFTGNREQAKGSFDNGASTSEMRMLARAFRATGEERYRDAFLKSVDLILKSQYPTGGWPQYYPPGKQYHRHITFNDGAMVLLMELLDEIATQPEYSFVDADRRQRAQKAFDHGIECILKCQILVNGKRTVWCAQHDEIDYSPRPARSYELVSLSGGESVGILRVLMGLDDPSPEVVEAITSAVDWYRVSQIEGLRVVSEGEKLKAVKDSKAPPLWARFYEIGTNRPLFSNRDGVPLYDFNQIDIERSTGYRWLGDWGEEVFGMYELWRRKWRDRLGGQTFEVMVIIGDSTVCNWPDQEVRRGWGQYIQGYFSKQLEVVNLARSGRSTKTFIQEGLWAKAMEEKPAYVLIQFGHNDSHDPGRPESTDADTDFAGYLRHYIDEARSAGAIPVLITPMHRRTFNTQGKLTDNLLPYAAAMKRVADEKKVGLVDLYAASGVLFEQLGPVGAAKLANAADDRTHFNEAGAKAMAALVMERLFIAEPSLERFSAQVSDGGKKAIETP
jgi:pectate lyase